MNLDALVLPVIGFVLGGLVTPWLQALAEKSGKEFLSTEKKILDAIKNPEFKVAMVGFMGRINDTMRDKENEEKFMAAVDFGVKWVTATVPGPLDDILLPPILKPIIKGWYDGYIKAAD